MTRVTAVTEDWAVRSWMLQWWEAVDGIHRTLKDACDPRMADCWPDLCARWAEIAAHSVHQLEKEIDFVAGLEAPRV